MKNKKNENRGISVGIALILVVIIIVCLVAFSVLAFSSAQSDYRLSEQVMKRKLEYIEACNTAEECLRDLDSLLCSIHTDSIGEFKDRIREKGFDTENTAVSCSELVLYDGTDAFEAGTLSLTVYINDRENLKISADILFNGENGRGSYRVTKYNTESIKADVTESGVFQNMDENIF